MIYLALALSLASAQSGSGIDNKQAAAVASNFAQKLGVHGLTVDKSELSAALYWGPPDKSIPMDVLSCSTPDGKKYVCEIIPPKNVISFVQQTEDSFGVTWSGPDAKFNLSHPPKEYDPKPLGLSALKAIGARGPYQYRPLRIANENPLTAAIFDMTVKGHRFFNTFPRYAYTVQVNLRTSEVLGLAVPPPLPPVNADKPKIDENKAKEILAQWAEKNSKLDKAARLLSDKWPGEKALKPELGYFMPGEGPTARLVWQGRVFWSIKNNPRYSGFCLNICVDALTGELITPDQELIN